MDTIFLVNPSINELAVVCKGVYSIFAAKSESFLSVDPGSERRSIAITDPELIVSLVLFLPQEQKIIIRRINSFVLIIHKI
jgi:hypothetical protein